MGVKEIPPKWDNTVETATVHIYLMQNCSSRRLKRNKRKVSWPFGATHYIKLQSNTQTEQLDLTPAIIDKINN